MKFYEYCYNVLVRFSSVNAPRSENSWGLDQSITLLLTPQKALDVARDFVNCQSELEAFDFTFDHFSLCEFKERNWFWIVHFNVTPKGHNGNFWGVDLCSSGAKNEDARLEPVPVAREPSMARVCGRKERGMKTQFTLHAPNSWSMS